MSDGATAALAKREGNLTGRPFQKGDDPRRWRGPPPEVLEVKRLAREHSKEAFEVLIGLMRAGSGAVRVQAAKAVLGVGGIALQPSGGEKGSSGLPAAPVNVSLRELVALVRGVALLPVEGAAGAMPRLSPSPGTPAGGAPSGAVDAEFREITGESGSSPSPAPGQSGSQPDGRLEGKEV